MAEKAAAAAATMMMLMTITNDVNVDNVADGAAWHSRGWHLEQWHTRGPNYGNAMHIYFGVWRTVCTVTASQIYENICVFN